MNWKPRHRGILSALLIGGCAAVAPRSQAQPREISLRTAIDNALLQNRQLQIERINQEVAAFTLKASYGYYDPVLDSRFGRETSKDTGGFDPANFSNDAIFDADSDVANVGLLGILPTGLTYTLGGNYAHSYGTRNFLNFDSYKITTGLTVEQPLLKNFWIDLPRWQIQVNKGNLKISELGVYFLAATVINLTQQGYYDLAYAWEVLRIQQSLMSTREEFLRGIQRQVELGALTVLEEKLAQSQTASIHTEVIGASNTVALASNNLRTLMGVTGEEWTLDPLVTSDRLIILPEVFDLHESWRTGLTHRSDLAQLSVNLKNADITQRFRWNQLFPSLNLFGFYGLRGSDAIQAFPPDDPKADQSLAFRQLEEQAAPNSTIGIVFSVPLTRTAERNNYKASKELKKQAELMVKQKEELILREIADAMDLARSSFNRADAARHAVQYAEAALQAEEQKLRGGTGSIFLVLQAQTDLARSRIAEVLARRDYNKALSQLYFTEGTLLDRIQLNVKFN